MKMTSIILQAQPITVFVQQIGRRLGEEFVLILQEHHLPVFDDLPTLVDDLPELEDHPPIEHNHIPVSDPNP